MSRSQYRWNGTVEVNRVPHIGTLNKTFQKRDTGNVINRNVSPLKDRQSLSSDCPLSQKNNKKMLLDLPDEILIHIVSFLSCLSLLSFRLTSRHLCRTTNDDAFLFSVPFLRIIPFRRSFTSLSPAPFSQFKHTISTGFLGKIVLHLHESGVSITFDSVRSLNESSAEKQHWIHFFNSNFVNQSKHFTQLNDEVPIYLKDRVVILMRFINGNMSHLFPSLIYKRGSIKFKWRVYHQYPMGLFEDLGFIKSFAPFYTGRFCVSLDDDLKTFHVVRVLRQNSFVVTRYDQNCNFLSEDDYNVPFKRHNIYNVSGCTVRHHYGNPLLLYQISNAIYFYSPMDRIIYCIEPHNRLRHLLFVSTSMIGTHFCYFVVQQSWEKTKLFSFDTCTQQIKKHISLPGLGYKDGLQTTFYDECTLLYANKFYEFNPKAGKPFLKQYLQVTAFTPSPVVSHVD